MASKSPSKSSSTSPSRRRVQHRSATIQWIALGVLAVLALLAAFVLFGDDSGGGGGHLGQAPSLAAW